MPDRLQMDRRLVLAAGAAGLMLPGCATVRPQAVAGQRIWTFDNLTTVGGLPVAAEGGPSLIDSAWGKAVKFDGVDDALFIDEHPLAGAATWTIEVLFRPEGGAFEQRFMHLAET